MIKTEKKKERLLVSKEEKSKGKMNVFVAICKNFHQNDYYLKIQNERDSHETKREIRIFYKSDLFLRLNCKEKKVVNVFQHGEGRP